MRPAVSHRSQEQHLDPAVVVAYVHAATDGMARRTIALHPASCAQCRSEVVEVGGIVRSIPHNSQRRYWIPALAAAAVLLLWIAPGINLDPVGVVHRDEAVTLTPAP